MKIIVLAVFLIAVVTLFSALANKKADASKNTKSFEVKPRIPVTANEQKMFWRLLGDFPAPDFVVLAQVSFAALMTSRRQADRNQFNRKRADFVICDKAFKVLAVVELDDASHKEDKDQGRDAMLKAAGFKVLRYRGIPNSGTVRTDVFASTETQKDTPKVL